MSGRVWTAYIEAPILSGNHVVRYVCRGKFAQPYPTPEAKAYRARLEPAFRETAPDPPIVHHRLVLAVPIDRRRDVDNMLRPIHNLLARAGVIVDDAYCDEVQVRRDPFVGDGVDVTVIEMEGDPATCSRCHLGRPHKPRGRKPRKEGK